MKNRLWNAAKTSERRVNQEREQGEMRVIDIKHTQRMKWGGHDV